MKPQVGDLITYDFDPVDQGIQRVGIIHKMTEHFVWINFVAGRFDEILRSEVELQHNFLKNGWKLIPCKTRRT